MTEHTPSPSTTDSALDLLRSRQWAGPDSNPSFERFLMSHAVGGAKRRFSTRFLIGLTLAGLTLSAAAAAEIYHQWVTLRLSNGAEESMLSIDNGDDTLTLVDKDGNTQTAYTLPPPDQTVDFDTLSDEQKAEILAQVADGEATFALVGGTVIDEHGNEIAVTYDLSDPDAGEHGPE